MLDYLNTLIASQPVAKTSFLKKLACFWLKGHFQAEIG
jgi:hypothetical protein